MEDFAWRCPFCGHHATIGTSNRTSSSNSFYDGNKYGTQQVIWNAISCPNPKCREYVFHLIIYDDPGPARPGENRILSKRHAWQLVPAAEMKVLPDYVPAAIVADYKEACLIATLSPKASATLARRCLQGMIRDFWVVKPGRLVDEIAAIEHQIDPDAWQAIQAVRSIGNIGAHMEADINLIVEVAPEEAKLMIALIETLVDEWYVARHERKSRLGKLADVAKGKHLARKKETGATGPTGDEGV